MSSAERLAQAVAAIDKANADDPSRLVVRGEERPKELAHAELMTEWVLRLRPDAGEPLLLAARAHHLRRWTVPRSSYPEGRAGYLRWRRDLHHKHAAEVGAILEPLGYDPVTVERVGQIVAKRNLAGDPEVQTLEDALCLVFLETQFHDLAARTEPEKMVTIVRKTLAKMSEQGRQLAFTIPMAEEDVALVQTALAPG